MKDHLCTYQWYRAFRRTVSGAPCRVDKFGGKKQWENKDQGLLLLSHFFPLSNVSASWWTATNSFSSFFPNLSCFNILIDTDRSRWTVYLILILSVVHFWLLNGITASNGESMSQSSFCLCLPRILLSILWLICKLWQMQNPCGAFLWWQTVTARKCCKYIFQPDVKNTGKNHAFRFYWAHVSCYNLLARINHISFSVVALGHLISQMDNNDLLLYRDVQSKLNL